MNDIIKKFNIKAKKSLWQNFLIDDLALENIKNSTKIKWENIVEVWPWYWALTEKICLDNPSDLSLIELDKDMVSVLNERFTAWEFKINESNFIINNIDVLAFEPTFSDYKVIANIPYYITSPILRHFLYEVENTPKSMTILMQKDVWDKILWKNKWKSSVLSLYIDKKCTKKEICIVDASSFSPPPKVTSSVLYFEKHSLFNDIDDDLFLNFIKDSFKEPRKKLIKNLNNTIEKDELIQLLSSIWKTENVRGEDLDINDYIYLLKKIKSLP